MSILNKDFSYFSGKYRNFNILQSLCKILSPEAIGEDKYGKIEEGKRREVDIEYLLIIWPGVIIKVITRDIGILTAMVARPWCQQNVNGFRH